MTGNGGDRTLAELENAIMQAKSSPSLPLTDRLNAAAEMCRTIADHARDHAVFVEEVSRTFAEHLEKMTTEFTTKVRESEQQFLTALESMLGDKRQ